MIRSYARRGAAIAALAIAAVALVACGSDDGEPGATSTGDAPSTTAAADGVSTTAAAADGDDVRTVSTAYGEVEVPTAPQRVVAVSYDTPWQLQAVGVRPVAVQDYGRWIDEFSAAQQDFVAGLPTIGSFGELNLEAIAAADPDLIVGDFAEIDESLYEQLSAIAPTAIAGGDARGDWQAIATTVADAAGAADASTAAIATYDAELARIKQTYAEQLARPWAHISLGNSEAEFSVQYATGVIGRMLFEELGATQAPSLPDIEPEAGYESFSFEEMGTILGDAEVVVHPLNSDGSDNPAVAAVLASEFFNPPAKTAGQVYGLTVSVTDYATATEYLHEIEDTILTQL